MANHTDAYFARQRELVALELKAEQEAYSRSLSERGATLTSTICEPRCRYPVEIGHASHNALGKATLEVRFEVLPDETEIDFEPGRPVTFFHYAIEGLRVLPYQCQVERVADGWMELSCSRSTAAQGLIDKASRHLLGVQLGVDNTSFRVMTAALEAAANSESERFLNLREVLLGHRAPTFRNLPRVVFPWLNASQQHAIQRAIEAMQVAIVHGPPGTGKTTTLVETIIETLHRETQVLVCAPSNAAVDWISEQLMLRGVHVLRIGNPLRMSDEMLDCSYERRYAAHPNYHELWNVRRDLLNAQGEHRERLRRRQNELEVQIQSDLFNQARVVSCTLIGASYHVMEHRHFGTLFIDEAAQALEPACWSAILKADRVIFGGDHQQLPPTVKSIEAQHDFSTTLMQKVVAFWPQAVTMLDIQYRMNNDIMAFPSRWFYGGRLRAAPEAAERLISPLDIPLIWIDTSSLDLAEQTTRQQSHDNIGEARLVVDLLRQCVNQLTRQKIENEHIDFGVITPYRGQVRLIKRLLKKRRFYHNLRRQISIGTVDGFQGQERDVIIISLVRSNEQGQIGFLRDLRRMNVAMTRARMKLIIVGDVETLAHHHFYRALIEHFDTHGKLLRLAPTDAPLPEQPEG